MYHASYPVFTIRIILMLTLRASLRLFKIVPDDFVIAPRFRLITALPALRSGVRGS